MRNFVVIFYPGFIDDVDKATSNLGGIEAISSATSCGCKGNLTLKCSDRMMEIPLEAKQSKTSGFVFRAIRNKKTNQVRYVVLGVAEKLYNFYGLSDYQLHVPKHITNNFTEIFGSEVLEADVQLYAIPPFISAYNHAITVDIARRKKMKTSEITNEAQSAAAYEGKVVAQAHNKAYVNCKEVPILTEELRNLHENMVPLYKERFNRFYNLLKQRKVIMVVELRHRLKISEGLIKMFLKITAYNWMDGPFRRCWAIFGFDPRQDPSTHMHQVMDHRIPSALHGKSEMYKSMHDGRKYVLNEKNIFKTGFYQYLNVELSSIKEFMENQELSTKFSEIDGWHTAGTTATIKSLTLEVFERYMGKDS